MCDDKDSDNQQLPANAVIYQENEMEVFREDSDKGLSDQETDARLGIPIFEDVSMPNTNYPDNPEDAHPYDEQFFNVDIIADTGNPTMAFLQHPHKDDLERIPRPNTKQEAENYLSEREWDEFHRSREAEERGNPEWYSDNDDD